MPTTPRSERTLTVILHELSWGEVLGIGMNIFGMVQLLSMFGPAATKSLLHRIALALPLCLVVAKDLVHAPESWQELRTALAQRQPRRPWWLALVPAALPGLVQLERRMWAGTWHRPWRRAPPALPADTALTYLERGAYGTASAIVLVGVGIELPVDAMIINALLTDPHTQAIVHVLGAAAVRYTLVWVLGDRWHIGAGQHVVDATTLHLRLGARVHGAVPLAAIERIETIEQPIAQWRRARSLARADTLSVSPCDQPNCVLVMKHDADVTVTHLQRAKRLPRYVFLYLDSPCTLAAALAARTPARG